MEVLGAVAAAGQLVGTAVKILELIAELREFLKNAHGKCQGWLTQLTALDHAISDIRLNPTLHTNNILHIVEAMYPKVQDLGTLLPRYSPGNSSGPKIRFTTRIRGALSARTVEARIIQLFQSLERDKTTLILTITTLNRSVTSSSYTKLEQDTEVVMENNRNTTQEMSSPAGPPHDTEMNQGQPGPGQSNGAAEADQPVQSPGVLSPTDGTLVEKIYSVGNDCIFTNSTARNMTMRDVRNRGDRTLAGAYTPEAFMAFLSSPVRNSHMARNGQTSQNTPR
ncbi:hypothetical protein F4814DRAFT_415821 [Daldinia grandis]|nr:hypothetical protein F4814DRAFT_415821 [Daldinia grandis]